ncbi:apoptotic chromatin condensation inducer in the nucleus-like isoform X2 [Centruroides sculpturatus]|nr:apoptotic chromatin condensation inducer in the nucleus-like isoform X2 [Centruroides sculpturatus]
MHHKSEDKKGIHYQSDEESSEVESKNKEEINDHQKDAKLDSFVDEIQIKTDVCEKKENLEIQHTMEVNAEIRSPENKTLSISKNSDDEQINIPSKIQEMEKTEDPINDISDKNDKIISDEKIVVTQTLDDDDKVTYNILSENATVNIVQKQEVLNDENISQDIEMKETEEELDKENCVSEKEKNQNNSACIPEDTSQIKDISVEETKQEEEKPNTYSDVPDTEKDHINNKIPEVEMAQGDDVTETFLDKDIKKVSIPETSEENPDTNDINYDNEKTNVINETLDYANKQVPYGQLKEASSISDKEHTKSKPVKLKRKKLEELPKPAESVADNQTYMTKDDQKRKWNEHKTNKNSEKDDDYSSGRKDNEDNLKSNPNSEFQGKMKDDDNDDDMEIDSKETNKNKNINSNYKRKTPKKRSSSSDSSSEDDKRKSRERKGHNKRSSSSSSDSSESNTEKSKSKRRRIESDKSKSHNIESSDENNYIRKERRREHSNSSESSDSQEANRRWGRKSKNKNENREDRSDSHYRSYGNRNYQSTSPGYRKLEQKYDSSVNQNRHEEHNRKSSPKEQKKEHKFSSQEETEVSDHREKQLSDKEVKEQSRRITTRKLSLSSSRKENQTLGNSERPQRKRRWGSSTKVATKPSVSISTDSLKDLIPDYKPVVKNVVLSSEELTPTANTPEEEALFGSQELNNQQTEIPGIPEISETDQVKEDTSKEESPHPPTPPQNPPSCIIHIKNLVRPFTLQQLKQVLQKTGTIVEGGFWIDKIKSKCYVTYETEDQASETRQALHATRWPPSNPKTLIVDFATKEELDYHKDLPDIPKLQNKEKSEEKKSGTLSNNSKKRDDDYDKRREKQKDERMIQHPIREWDRDKLTQDSPEHDRRTKDRSRERGRSPDRREKKEKKDSKRKQEEETPAKLLDDLFRKTKSTPCIYWLPLTEEQIHQREQERKQRQIEREKRRQQRDQEDREREEAERLQRQKARENRSGKDKENAQQSRSPLGRKR